MSSLYFNEIDPFAAAWLGNLFPSAVIDQRSITDVKAADLAGYDRVHLFGGIGGWELALHLAGWPANWPAWTGSCPCQPYSAAGKQKGQADERHLWPEMFRLIRQCRPPVVFGEQVDRAIKFGWLDGVFADLEREGYACGAVVLGAHSVGAPHIRQRIYWVANGGSQPGRIAAESDGPVTATSGPVRLGDPESVRRDSGRDNGNATERGNGTTGITGAWCGYDLIPCRDGKTRRIESGTFPLVARLSDQLVRSGDTGSPINAKATAEARKMRLRGYGNAIVPQVAAEFVRAFLETQQQ